MVKLIAKFSFTNDAVYFTDEDGFLDYDADKEFETALRLNPDVEYWQDDF